ncbi:MAG: tRNA (adenosine(37)-N6)-dimethylallyltransferase MiaA [Bacteroidota bacterium]
MPVRKYLISIVGPTAVGKTRLAVFLAQQLGTEVLSFDSRQMYRGMDIGTAKPGEAEAQGVPHHFVDFLEPDEPYDAARFAEQALGWIQGYMAKNQALILVGGSTLYIDALWHEFSEIPPVPPEIRNALTESWKKEGLSPLLAELDKVDPQTGSLIDRANPVRIIRALEVFRATGNPISHYRKGRKKRDLPYTWINIGLEDERDLLYERIDQRVEEMLKQGLEKEVKNLIKAGFSQELSALQSIGYREFFPYWQGTYDYEEVVRLIKRNSRRYAKRQLTWFKRYPDITWFPAGAMQEVLDWLNPNMTDLTPD